MAMVRPLEVRPRAQRRERRGVVAVGLGGRERIGKRHGSAADGGK